MPAPLRNEVRLLGAVLGQVLVETGGRDLLDDVERLRHATIEARRARGPVAEELRAGVVALVAAFSEARAEEVARAFTVYFQLVNLAEERQRVRTLRERSRVEATVRESVAATLAELGPAALQGLEVHPVLTAHPTEARRRAVVDALRRVGEVMEHLDDPRAPASGLADAERRLREEVAILWRTAQLRGESPTPLDEVRAVMSVFDESLFRLVPVLYREVDRAVSGVEASGTRAPAFRPFLRWGSWVGGDRDGNPAVTHEVTREAMEIQADHVLRGLEAAARRVGRSLTASDRVTPPAPDLLASLAADEGALPEVAAEIRKRSPGEPHRSKLLLVAERLAATRLGRPGAYAGAAECLADLRLLQGSLERGGAARLAFGELQHLAWQVETFGFHLASLEVRQHSLVHRAALEELGVDAADATALDKAQSLPPQGGRGRPRPVGGTAAEVLATLRTMADLQRRWGPDACRRYVVSFTRSAADVVAVHALAGLAGAELELDVVPLFESRADLEAAPRVLGELAALPGWRARLERRGRRAEVMLGYSDSAKDVGFLAANLALYRAQGELAAWARRTGVELTLFHGRGGAVGRGGGPAGRAIRGQAPGSVAGRFKVTEQGEVIFARYGSAAIGLRHLEQVTSAVLTASSPAHEAVLLDAERRFAAEAALLAEVSEAAYRDLVERPGFADFFADVTPLEEMARLRLGSRPARRAGARGLADLRAIPWVFAWAQNRCNLPGWYGLGAGLEAVAARSGLDRLRRMRTEWPFFDSLLDNAAMSLAKADPMIAGLFLDLGGRPDLVAAIREEFRRTRRLVLAVGEQDRLLANRPVLRRAVDLRNPYVDALSFLQHRFLSELRAGVPDAERAARLADLVLLTVNGVAAGLQNTG